MNIENIKESSEENKESSDDFELIETIENEEIPHYVLEIQDVSIKHSASFQ